MRFDFVIGNPPYQEEQKDNGRQPPIYHLFMDEAYAISDCVELITPARFLFDAGQTPKEWNRKMLSDKHFKVLKYESDASKIFSNTEIKGGVAISIRNAKKEFGAIGIFTEFPILNEILQKVLPNCDKNLSQICVGAVPYRFADKLKEEKPEAVALAGDSFDLRTNVLDKLAGKVFFDNQFNNEKYLKIYGLYDKKRAAMWVKEAYIVGPSNLNQYKVLVSKANGSGRFGEALSQMIQAAPMEGHTQSFISIGSFASGLEAKNLEKYIKTKFCRCLLSVLRTTQDITPSKWKYVPTQDFSSESDIQWNSSITNIDRQLYKKYGLTDEEACFIETNVKEML